MNHLTPAKLRRGSAVPAIAALLAGALALGALPATASAAPSTAHRFRAPTVVPAADVLSVRGPATGTRHVVLDSRETTVRPGQILVTGPGRQTPHGLLVKVTVVTRDGAGVDATTVPANISDALAPGHYTKAISIVEPIALRRVHPSATTGPITWSVPISTGVKCDGSVTATVDGSLQISPTANVDINVDLFGLHSASLSMGLSEDASLHASLAAAAHCTATVPVIANVPVGGFFIGPLYIQPTFSVTLDALLNANASASISGAQHFRGSVGVAYDQTTGLQATRSASNTFDVSPPQLSGSATLEGGVTASLSLLIAGLAGPRVDARGYLGVTADSTSVPWWTFYGGITVTGGLKVLTYDVGSLTIWQQRWTLAQALGLAGSTLPTANPGSWYTQILSAIGGTAPYRYDIASGSLPAGLSLSGSGVITGTPAPVPANQTNTVVVRATDAAGNTTTAQYSILVPGLAVDTTTLPSAAPFDTYTATLNAVGAVGPETWTLTAGTLPAGLTLASNGTISGTVAATATTATFTVSVTDSTGRHVSGTINLPVTKLPIHCLPKLCTLN